MESWQASFCFSFMVVVVQPDVRRMKTRVNLVCRLSSSWFRRQRGRIKIPRRVSTYQHFKFSYISLKKRRHDDFESPFINAEDKKNICASYAFFIHVTAVSSVRLLFVCFHFCHVGDTCQLVKFFF